MWLLLCTIDDSSALWAAARLRARGLWPITILTPELLHFSFRWRHRLGNDRAVSVEFTLASGQTIRGDDVRGVLNRIPALPPSLFERMTEQDRAYAVQEWTALHVSWLTALDAPVLNLPVPHGLCGAWRHASEWTWMASQAGLLTPRFSQKGSLASEPAAHRGRSPLETRLVFVLDGHVVAANLDPGTAGACVRLARAAHTRLLGITLDRSTGEFLDASPRPPLQAGGEPLIDVLHAALTGASRS